MLVSSTDSLDTGHLPVRLRATFETEQLPTCVSNLDACLTQVTADDLVYCSDEGCKVFSSRDWF